MTTPHSTDPLVGDVLDGRYEVLTRMARGGMATVYRAWDRRLERIVAIKVMHEGLGDDADFVGKFDREARAAARLCDQSVVSIFDQGHDHGRPYIVMEFVEGSTLRTEITREAPLNPLRAMQLIEPVAAALAVAHESGLVHRDVKPENVLISDLGAVKVADFGLARTITAQTAAHTQGLLIGTVSYLPPELLTSGRASSYSDVYSTGIMLFEMLTGKKPYTGDSPITVAYKHVNENVPAPSQVLAKVNPGQARREPIPDYVDALVIACTRRNPASRPVDGRELLHRVRRVRRALERGIRNDESLAALVFPAASLPWALDQTEVLSPDVTPTSVLATTPPAPPAQPALPAPAADDRPTPVQPIPAIADPIAVSQPVTPQPIVTRSQPTPDEYVVEERDDESVATRYPKLSRAPEHRRRRGIVVTILVLLLALGVGLGSWWFTSGRYVAAPALVGQTREDAAAIAAANEMTIIFSEDFSETVPVNVVISTEPGPGEQMIRKSQISAVVSKGPERFAVPALYGLTLDEAKASLAAVNLVVGVVTEAYSEEVETGRIVGATLGEGELVPRNTAVDLTISKGREPLTIPNVEEMTLDDATKLLTETGFQVEVSANEFSADVPNGSVISQDPRNGTGFRGDVIKLVVSRGPELVKFPDIKRGDRVTEAHKVLTEAGFSVEVRLEPGLLTQTYTVTRVTDAAGVELKKDDELPKGAVVVVYGGR